MSSVRGVNVGGNLYGVTDSTNIAPIEATNFATRGYAVDRCFIMADGLLYRATAEIESGDPIVINGNCKRTTLDEIISVIETDSDLIAPTEDGDTSSADYVVGDEIVRSSILYKVISAITEGDAFVIGNNIDIAGSLTSQIQTLTNQKADKSDLTTVVQNGTNATQNIARDTFFYLNGELVHALQAISNGSAFTLGTNYEKVPIGGLNLLSARFTKTSFSGELNSEGFINIAGNVNSNFPIGVITSRRGWAYAFVTGTEVWSLYVYDPVTGQHATGNISGTAYFIMTY